MERNVVTTTISERNAGHIRAASHSLLRQRHMVSLFNQRGRSNKHLVRLKSMKTLISDTFYQTWKRFSERFSCFQTVIKHGHGRSTTPWFLWVAFIPAVDFHRLTVFVKPSEPQTLCGSVGTLSQPIGCFLIAGPLWKQHKVAVLRC